MCQLMTGVNAPRPTYTVISMTNSQEEPWFVMPLTGGDQAKARCTKGLHTVLLPSGIVTIVTCRIIWRSVFCDNMHLASHV